MNKDLSNIRDLAWEKINIDSQVLKQFKVSIFWILWYKALKNDAELISFLNLYRKYNNQKKDKVL